MSELKAFDVGLGRCTEDGSPCVVAFDADENPRLLNEKVYLKDEVDAVISELRQQIQEERSAKVDYKISARDLGDGLKEAQEDYKEACDRLQTANLIKDEQFAAARHHKYKRCLAMARWCECERIGATDYTIEKWKFYDKWNKRWLALAEQFKEAFK